MTIIIFQLHLFPSDMLRKLVGVTDCLRQRLTCHPDSSPKVDALDGEMFCRGGDVMHKSFSMLDHYLKEYQKMTSLDSMFYAV